MEGEEAPDCDSGMNGMAHLCLTSHCKRGTNCVFSIDGNYTKVEMQAILHMNTKLVHIECGGWDKYGRLLADFFVDGCHINTDMIAQNHGYPYDGGKKLVDGV